MGLRVLGSLLWVQTSSEQPQPLLHGLWLLEINGEVSEVSSETVLSMNNYSVGPNVIDGVHT